MSWTTWSASTRTWTSTSLAVVAAPAGAVVAGRAVRRERARLSAALRFASEHAPAVPASGRSRAQAATAPALPATSPAAARRCSRSAARRGAERRLRGKDDSLDAARTARAALASETLALPRSGERREALRLLLVARRSAVDVRREALAQLRAVIVTAPTSSASELRGLPVGEAARALQPPPPLELSSADELATRLVLRSLARRIQAATLEAAELEREILAHVRALAPRLLDEPGVGPIVAAQLIVAWSHPGRLRSEAAFARLAGVAPVPASSGQTTRHRLSRGGDRQLNRALHTIVLHRRQHDPDDQGLHRATDRRGQEPPRRHPPTQALPRPPPLPTTRNRSR